MGSALGKNSALLMSKTTIAADDGVDLVSESLVNEKRTFDEDTESIWGGRQLDVANQIVVAEAPAGSFVYRPRYTDLSLLFELILGDGDDAAWTPLESGELPAFNIEVHKAGVHDEAWTNCYMNQLVLRSEQNKALTAEPTVIAKSAAVESSPTTPTYADVGGVAPIMHNDLVITGDAGLTGLKPFSIQWTFRNNMNDDGFANSKNRQYVEGEGFETDLEMEVALDSTLAGNIATWYNASPKTPLEVIGTYSSGGLSLGITFRGVITSPPPNIDSPGRQKYTLTASGRATWGGTPYAITEDMVSVAVDDTPE